MIVGQSVSIRRALVLAERYARTRLPILLVGPTGTGKELLAQHIHERSGRPGRLVDLNCCALPCDMIESLLFGHRRGAFTGAVESTVGFVERSDGGTLFLDELASLHAEAQGKLLRVLESGEIQRLGAISKQCIDLRVVSAAQNDIGMAVESGTFRRDLFQRVAGVVIELLSLTERPEDIVPLAGYFARLRERRLEPGVERVLLGHTWPGNVRELKMVIERAGELVDNGTLSPAAVREAIALGLAPHRDVSPTTMSGRRAEWLQICESYLWDEHRITAGLGISRSTLYRWLRTVGISLRAQRMLYRSSRGSVDDSWQGSEEGSPASPSDHVSADPAKADGVSAT